MKTWIIATIVILSMSIIVGISYASTSDLTLQTNASLGTHLSLGRSDSYMVNYPASVTMFGSGANNMQGVIQFNTTNAGFYNGPSVERMRIGTSGDVIMPSGEKFYVDGGSNTYMVQDSPNNFDIYVEGTKAFEIGGGNSYNFGNSILQTNASPGTHLSLGRSDSYMVNYPASVTMFGSGANNMQGVIQFNTTNAGFYNGPSVERMRIGTSGDVIMPSGEKFYVDGGSNTYMVQDSPNNFDIYVGGVRQLSIGPDVCIGTC